MRRVCIIAALLVVAFVKAHSQAPAFDARTRLPCDTGVSDIRSFDIDGDGKPELVATNPELRLLMVFQNKSRKGKLDTTSFLKPLVYATGAQPVIAGIADMNGDNKPDIVVMNNNDATGNTLVFFQNASVSGKIKLSAVAMSDSTAATPACYNFPLIPGDDLIRVDDVDGDAIPDIVALNTGGFISVYHNARKPVKNIMDAHVTIPLKFRPVSVEVKDIDGNGRPDMILANRDSASLTVLLARPANEMLSPSSFSEVIVPLDFYPTTATISDLDKDGRNDVLVCGEDNVSGVLHNTSIAGNFSTILVKLPGIPVSGNYNNELVLADIAGNQRKGLLSLNPAINHVYWYANKTASGKYFDKKVNCPVIAIPDCISDLDGDGKADLVIGSSFGVDLYRNSSAVIKTTVAVEVNQNEMHVYPNPASVTASIKYFLTASSNVVINVYNETGKLLQSFLKENQPAGSHVYVVKTASFKPGVYVIAFNAGNYSKTEKLIVQHE